MKKIYASPSDQTRNVYAYGNTNEAAQCRKISLRLVDALIRCGFEAKTNTTDGMYARVRESNDWGADLHVPIHTNAYNGKVKGTRLFSYDMSGNGYKACMSIMETLAPITPGESDGVSPRPDLYEVNSAKAYTAYIEVAFHDNAEEAKWIIEHTQDIAEAICKGICNYFGVDYVEVDAPADPEEPAEPVVADVVTVRLLVLKKGSFGEEVKPLQRLLHAQGYGLGSLNPIDGDFGSMTDTAVKVYQKDNGLEVDGIVGQETWTHLLGAK